MYQNGRKVNRYATMRRHKKMLRRKHTPRYYDSYKSFLDDMENMEKGYFEEDRDCTSEGLPFYLQWWKPYSDVGTSQLRRLKNNSHREIRRENKSYCYNALNMIDLDDLESARPAHLQGDDIWYYV